MKKRVLALFLALMCMFTMIATPALAYDPPSGEDQAITYSDTVRWYFRMNNGVKEMRLWSITQQRWLTDWVVCPDQP